MCPARLGVGRCLESPDHFLGVFVRPVRCAGDRGALGPLTTSTSAVCPVRDVCVLGVLRCHRSLKQLCTGTCVLQV